jgi:thiamine-phosphate pyrophosphorylase
VVNDRPDVAVAAGADGVHVGQNDLPVPWVRRIVGAECLIGLSTHSEAELAGADPQADYLCAGPVYATPTKPGRPATGLALIAAAARREREEIDTRPWFAIGGIDAENADAVRAEGATRIVVVRAIGEAADPAGAARQLVRIMHEQFEAC